MRWLLALPFLGLAACQQNQLDLSSQQNIQLACEGATLAYAVFEAVAAEKVKPAVLIQIRGAYAGVGSVCANPPSNQGEALLAAIKAVQAFKAQVDAAKRNST